MLELGWVISHGFTTNVNDINHELLCAWFTVRQFTRQAVLTDTGFQLPLLGSENQVPEVKNVNEV